jgi:hypothetical protein
VTLLWWVSSALARSWCASPLVVHEWGVQVLRTDGAEPVGVPMPSWFHRSGTSPAVGEPVRHLPPDTGIRTLPVVQWYAPVQRDLPAALEVGFTLGEAAVWWPAVDVLRPATEANSERARQARRELEQARARRDPLRDNPPLPSDPTRQLGWDRLDLRVQAPARLPPAEVDWVEALRAMPGALWVERGSQADRFVFYEATTTERPSVVLERGESWGPGRQHVVLRNVGDWAVHDVVLVANGRVVTVPSIPAGATAGFLLQDPLERDELLSWLGSRWIDAKRPTAPTSWEMDMEDCAMMRDPAVPVEEAASHRLYRPEVELLLQVWGERLAESEGVHLVYREDVAQLDARMPLSVYTDMLHTLELRRLGVVLVEGTVLPD